MNWLNLIKDIVDNWRTIPDEAIVIVLLGPTGSGRSTFINAAIGDEHCEASGSMKRTARLSDDSPSSLDPITKVVQRVHYKTSDRKFVFIDTPGLDLEEFTPAKSALRLPNGRLVDGIIYLHRVNTPRVTTSPQTYEKVFQGLVGNEWEKKTLFATTMWKEVDNSKGEDRQQKLEETYWQQAKQRGAKVDRFLGERDDAWRLINRLTS
ncbi:hypothetical protein BDN71DRAFT_1455359 [Pleurotus eryngii]|uniref:G domain-containing protein n=1 Tax=Pleurotus eryngii TaxID=5323 RepID=A0A9P6D2F6_PLEER|nr:hypothetical protein BDN71DRAFT_1455359 [Pleurotus eryngii]